MFVVSIVDMLFKLLFLVIRRLVTIIYCVVSHGAHKSDINYDYGLHRTRVLIFLVVYSGVTIKMALLNLQ